jgi:glutamate dehydrogenase/leucine dehydrogenase
MAETVIKINLEKYRVDGEGILVIDTIERSVPAKGGIRVHQNVTEQEIADLAREMTKKCTLAGIPFGGAKGGIRMSNLDNINRAMYGFGRELAKLDFIPYKWCAAPDINTNCESVDAFIAGCASVKGWRKSRLAATGKSTGIPHELGSTGYGVVLAVETLIAELGLDIDLSAASAIVEGTGEVGGNAVRFMIEKGVTIRGVSDISGALYSPVGLDSELLMKCVEEGVSVKEMTGKFDNIVYFADSGSLLEQEADILILAGPGRSITGDNWDKLQVGIIGEGANLAISTSEVREKIARKGIHSIPGIIANSGGVISSYEEWMVENENLVLQSLDEKWERVKVSLTSRITRNIKDLAVKIKEHPCRSTYELALNLADERLEVFQDETRTLRSMTKSINKDLEEKYSVFTL